MFNRQTSPLDNLITRFDQAARIVTGNVGPTDRPSPAAEVESEQLSPEDRLESARLMRVNHCGEVCAQALYNGQALTARDERTSNALKQAASEETDHLAWCEKRLEELDSHVSHLNPFWYAASFSMGAVTGLLGDKINLGFVAATEDQVSKHLADHLKRLPPGDEKSRLILEQMKSDEESHKQTALDLGGAHFPQPVRKVMRAISKLMTRSTYWV